MVNLTPLPSLSLLCLSGPNLVLVGVMFAIVESLKLYAVKSVALVDTIIIQCGLAKSHHGGLK